MQELVGSGHQEASNAFTGYHPYDHPYFGQIFLALLLKVVDFPNSLHPVAGDVTSIQMLHMVPRIFMGILAVIDTFLVYKISVIRYNRTVALAASILFAVMPMTWLLRRVLLDSILLPFLLSSVLFAVYYKSIVNRNARSSQEVPVVILSGIFLGLAIFTKIPVFCMIPLVGYLVATAASKNKRRKILGIWIIPVILIPTIWPTYSILYGQFDMWIDGVLSQTSRLPVSVFESMEFTFEIDPVLITLGVLGAAWMTIRRDFFFVLWIVPYIIFLGIIGYSQYIHMVLLLPLFSIAAAILIQDVSDKLGLSFTQSLNNLIHSIKQLTGKLRHLLIPSTSTLTTKPHNDQRDLTQFLDTNTTKPPHDEQNLTPSLDTSTTKLPNVQQDLTPFLGNHHVSKARSTEPRPTNQPTGKHLGMDTKHLSPVIFVLVFAAVSIFGLTSTILLVTTDVNGSLFEAYAAFVGYLPEDDDNSVDDEVTLNTSVKWGTYFYWIPKYIFNKELIFLDERENEIPSTQKVIIIRGTTDNDEDKAVMDSMVLLGKVNNTARYFDLEKYPYDNMKYNELGYLDVKGNY